MLLSISSACFLRVPLRALRLCVIFSLCLACSAAHAQYLRPADVNKLPSAPADHRLAYGSDPAQFGDLRLPKMPGPHPVVIVIHGGCWVESYADVQNTAALSDALRASGVATWNIEYRRADMRGGGWPGTFRDVAAAGDFLRTIAGKYKLDLSRVVAIGHSAGGHLALWLAARHRLPAASPLASPEPLRLRGAVVLGGPGDLKAWLEHGERVCGGPVVTKLMGGTPEQVPERYAHGSPAELLPLGVPQTFLTGADDGVAPARFAEAYAQAARSRGDTVEHVVIDRAGHHEYNAPNSPAWPHVKSAVLSLLGRGEK
jgi:acetyl esterase/lipase